MDRRLFLAMTAMGWLAFMVAAALGNWHSHARAQQLGLTDIVVARNEIPLGSTLYQNNLAIVQVPKAVLPEQFYTRVEDVDGRFVATNLIGPREPITKHRVTRVFMGCCGPGIPEDYRAITVRVADDDAVTAEQLIPGMLVDLMFVTKPETRRHAKPIAKLLLQNVKVLATGQNMALPKEQVEPTRVNSLTLLVTLQQAKKVMLASYDIPFPSPRILVRSFCGQRVATQPAT